MKWLVDVLAQHAYFDLEHAPSRELLAEAILEAIPKHVVVDAISTAASAVLRSRGIPDGARDLARELANNATHTVLAVLLVDPDPANELAIPQAVAR